MAPSTWEGAHYRRCVTDPVLVEVFGTRGSDRHVEAFLASADEARLPSDPRFREALHAYRERGTPIARDVSQPGADVSSDAPVPVWTWDGPAR